MATAKTLANPKKRTPRTRSKKRTPPGVISSEGVSAIMSLMRAIPSPMKIREELEQMVLKDLLGPVGGPEEEIDEQSVRDRYLVGMLAPKRQELSPEEFDELPQGGSGSVEDGTTESTSLAAKTMFPSSFGMTSCVGLEAKALQVTARWGHYHRDRSQTLTNASGDKK